jgi:hypothetical protein
MLVTYDVVNGDGVRTHVYVAGRHLFGRRVDTLGIRHALMAALRDEIASRHPGATVHFGRLGWRGTDAPTASAWALRDDLPAPDYELGTLEQVEVKVAFVEQADPALRTVSAIPVPGFPKTPDTPNSRS